MKKSISVLMAAILLVSCLSVFADPEAGVEITDRINETGSYSDSVGNEWTYSYRLPRISGAETEYITKINSDMDSLMNNYIQPGLDGIKDGYSLNTVTTGYEFTRTGSIISLLVNVCSDWDSRLQFIYNFDSSGNEVTNIELLAAAGYTPEEFLRSAQDSLNSYFSVFGLPGELAGSMEQCRQKTVAPENCNLEMPMYLGPDGLVLFSAKVYSVAGADFYYHIFALPNETGFTEDQIVSLALAYCEYSEGYRPQYVSVEIDGFEASVQLYDIVDGHTATSNWYYIDPYSGVGTDIVGFPINIACR